MSNRLEGRHALITGGGTGIGASCATQLSAAGAKVTVAGRRLEPLQDIAKRLSGYAVSCDVTQPEQYMQLPRHDHAASSQARSHSCCSPEQLRRDATGPQ